MPAASHGSTTKPFHPMKKHFRITVNGKEFDVVAESLDAGDTSPPPRRTTVPLVPSAAPRQSAAPAPSPAAVPAAAGDGDVISPLAGKVVSIDAPVGTAVKAGEKVVTLEAMKMNTIVASPVDGTVKSVAVQVGDGVEEGQVLLNIG